MRKRRRARRNAFFGFPMLHRKAARLGWGRRRSKRRKTRRNAGSSLSLKGTTRALGAGFSLPVWKRAATILGGNISTTWASEKLMGYLPILGSNKALDIATVLAVASLNGYLAGKLKYTRRYANDLFIGGILAGVTRLAKMVLPGTFATCGLSEDLEGLGSYFVSPQQIASAMNTTGQQSNYRYMAGLGWAPGPSTPRILAGWGPMDGMGDHAVYPQVQPGNVVTLDGLANLAVQEEIASQM